MTTLGTLQFRKAQHVQARIIDSLRNVLFTFIFSIPLMDVFMENYKTFRTIPFFLPL